MFIILYIYINRNSSYNMIIFTFEQHIINNFKDNKILLFKGKIICEKK